MQILCKSVVGDCYVVDPSMNNSNGDAISVIIVAILNLALKTKLILSYNSLYTCTIPLFLTW